MMEAKIRKPAVAGSFLLAMPKNSARMFRIVSLGARTL